MPRNDKNDRWRSDLTEEVTFSGTAIDNVKEDEDEDEDEDET